MEQSVINPFANTLLEGVYTPIVFSNNDSVSTITTIPLLPDSSSNIIEKGFAFLAKNLPEVKLASVDSIKPLADALKIVDSFWEQISRKKEYKNVVIAYNNLLNSINQDFEAYSALHEDCLRIASKSVDIINRQKTLMKDYLLLELFELLSFAGQDIEFRDIEFEQLDLRQWPIDNKYNLIKEQNLELIKDLEDETILKYMSSASAICGVALTSARFIAPRVSPILGVPLLLYSPIKNRVLVKKVKKKISKLEPISSANQAVMLADLCQLNEFAMSLDNIAKIYESIYQDIRPIIKRVMTDLEYTYSKDLNTLPKEKKVALNKMKRILKELAEKNILLKDVKKEERMAEVCRYSNDISKRFIDLKKTINENFNTSLTTS